jgi:hypothetical protein
MFSIEGIVTFVLYMLGAGLVFALLNYLIDYVAGSFPSMSPFAKFAKIGLMVAAVLVLIGVIMSFMGHPLVTLR